MASAEKLGQRPYWPDSALRRAIRPAALRAQIAKHIGWHTFRHSFATLLQANGEDVMVVQSLRHACATQTAGSRWMFTRAGLDADQAPRKGPRGKILIGPTPGTLVAAGA